MSPTDFTTAYTLEFVTRHLSLSRPSVLEIGCGNGRLARGLSDLGYDVVAVDGDRDAVASARQLGVTAHHAEWPDLDVSGFDAVLFTRSLHHIHSLGPALEHARTVLNPGGQILVEDFQYLDLDDRTIEWFARTAHLLVEAGVLDQPSDWLRALSQATNPVPLWRTNHGHDLHSADTLHKALAEVFGSVARTGAAYFFRYILRSIRDAHAQERVGRAFAMLEESLGMAQQIQPLGQRFVATHA